MTYSPASQQDTNASSSHARSPSFNGELTPFEQTLLLHQTGPGTSISELLQHTKSPPFVRPSTDKILSTSFTSFLYESKRTVISFQCASPIFSMRYCTSAGQIQSPYGRGINNACHIGKVPSQNGSISAFQRIRHMLISQIDRRNDLRRTLVVKIGAIHHLA